MLPAKAYQLLKSINPPSSALSIDTKSLRPGGLLVLGSGSIQPGAWACSVVYV